MRVTESQLIDLAAEGVAKNRDKMGEVSQVASTGVKVSVPSQDVVAWSEAARAAARNTLSTTRGTMIARSQERLTTADDALSTVTSVLDSAYQLATQMANGVYDAQSRANAAGQASTLLSTALAAANSQDNSGEYVFSGSQTLTQPFDANGVYQGDTVQRSIEIGEQQQQTVTLDGSLFTAANGVDVFATLKQLSTDLAANDQQGVHNLLGDIQTAIKQVARGHTVIGARQQALQTADDSRQTLETNLASVQSRAVGADPIKAASDLAQENIALQNAEATAQQIMSLVQKL